MLAFTQHAREQLEDLVEALESARAVSAVRQRDAPTRAN
jgi:hypothetical protein